MDSLISTIVAYLFGFIGATFIWIYKRGETPYKDILFKRQFISGVIGLLIVLIVGAIFYFNRR